MRSPAPRNKPRRVKGKSFPAPVGGWVANQNLAAPDPKLPASAAMLENWFPTATGVRMRSGSDLYGTIGDGSADVRSLFAYVDGSNEKLFAATASAIYDITTISDVSVSPSAAVSSLTGGDWSSVQFATAGGTFLRLVNGSDDPLVYNGTAFVAPNYSDPLTFPISGSGLDPKKLSFGWAFKQRMFFIEKNSLNAWYLDVDVIAGTATKFPMGGIFQRGGSLLFGASWSLDDSSGLNASCVFVTTEGEVAVYQGSNPNSIDNWALVGVYRIGRPLGPKAFIRAGGDLVIATDVGAIPLSQAIQRDVAALAPAAVSYPIETEWNAAVKSRSFAPWHCEVWPTRQMVLVVPASNSSNAPFIFAANARTGAWAKYTGWKATCLQSFGARLFFGSSNGKIVEAEVTGADQGAPYTASCVPLFDSLKSPASLKTVGLARATLLAPYPVSERLSIQTDYAINLPSAPNDTVAEVTSQWGSGRWGVSRWANALVRRVYQNWRSVFGRGYAIAPAIQITSGDAAAPLVELVSIDITYDEGDIVT